MARWMGMLSLALAGAALIARPAAAQTAVYEVVPAYSAETGYVSGSRQVEVYVNGRLVDSGADAYARTYETAGGHPAPSGCSAPAPVRRCPPGGGEIHLPDSFFIGGGGVGPEMVWIGGGGGYWIAGGTAYAGGFASAYARAGSSVRVSGGGGPPRPRGGCGCH